MSSSGMEDDTPLRIRVNNDYRITLPKSVRIAAGISAGDIVLIDVCDGAMTVIRDPEDHVARERGLSKGVSEGVDNDA